MPSAAQANGQVVNFVQKTAGPYEIAFGTSPSTPSVGALHLTMTVADASSKRLIPNAVVTVTGRGPGVGQGGVAHLGPLFAQTNSAFPNFYDVNTRVDSEGTWTFTVAVSSRLGDAEADFPVKVGKSSIIPGVVTLASLLVFVVIVGLSVRMYLSGRGRRKGPESET
jgi:hypothetical protein